LCELQWHRSVDHLSWFKAVRTFLQRLVVVLEDTDSKPHASRPRAKQAALRVSAHQKAARRQ
jgi:hypothetical protein